MEYMNFARVKLSPRQTLLSLLIIYAILTAAYNLVDERLFYPSLMSGIVVVLYALWIRCPRCRKMQVFRGPSFFNLRMVGTKCYSCGAPLGGKVQGATPRKGSDSHD